MVSQFSIAYRLINKCKYGAIQRDKFFPPSGRPGLGFARHNQMHRHGIEQFIGKMNSSERLERIN